MNDLIQKVLSRPNFNLDEVNHVMHELRSRPNFDLDEVIHIMHERLTGAIEEQAMTS